MTGSQKVRCVALVAGGWRIEGVVHIMPGTRLTDMMNSNLKTFIPVTDAVVYDGAGLEIARPSYLAMNRDHVTVISPLDE